MIAYTLSFLLVSVLAVFMHILVCFLNKKASLFDSDFRKLMYHWKLTVFIWVILFPLGIYLKSKFQFVLIDVADSRVLFAVFTLSLYLMLFFVYLTVYYTIDRSVSSKMMIILLKNDRLTKEQLFEEFDIDEKYHNILLGMHQGGFIRRKKDRYVLTLKGIMVGYIAFFFKKVLRLGKGG